MSNANGNGKRSKGGVRRPRGPNQTWSYVIDIGLQDAVRCTVCNKREWIGARRLETCPKCGGALRVTRERRKLERSGFSSEREAKAAWAAAFTKRTKGDYRPPSGLTLAGFLRDVWLPGLENSDLKGSTRESYERHVAYHLIGPASEPFAIATTRLTSLGWKAIDTHYKALASGYPRECVRGGKTVIVPCPGLAKASVRKVHGVLHAALNAACQERLIERNPAARLGRRIVGNKDEKPKALAFWEPAELQRFLQFTRHAVSPLGTYWPLWTLLAHTGMRRGEALGLQWGDFNLKAATVTISRNRVPLAAGVVETTTPKTKGSVRTLDLDPETVAAVKLWRELQRGGKVVALAQEDAWVFADDNGEPWHPHTVSWAFRRAVEAANLDAEDPATPKATQLRPLSVHGLRHTFATIALQAGVPVTVVSKYLGHSSVTMTLNVYSHVLRGAQRELAGTVAGVIRRGSF